MAWSTVRPRAAAVDLAAVTALGTSAGPEAVMPTRSTCCDERFGAASARRGAGVLVVGAGLRRLVASGADAAAEHRAKLRQRLRAAPDQRDDQDDDQDDGNVGHVAMVLRPPCGSAGPQGSSRGNAAIVRSWHVMIEPDRCSS